MIEVGKSDCATKDELDAAKTEILNSIPSPSVQHFEGESGANPINVTIGAVDLTRAFIVNGSFLDGGYSDLDGAARARLTSATNVSIERYVTSGNLQYSFSVVEL